MRKKIGLIGGSFDPIHIGHLIIAQDACERFGLDQALFIPAYQAPLKSKLPSASPKQRMEMVELAISGNPLFAASDVDYRSEGTSYSVNTVKIVGNENPGAELYWILGADQIAQLHKWRNIAELSERVQFIAFERSGNSSVPHEDLPANARILKSEERLLDVSSTEIRDRLNSGDSAKYFLPDSVFDYIKAKNLYRQR